MKIVLHFCQARSIRRGIHNDAPRSSRFRISISLTRTTSRLQYMSQEQNIPKYVSRLRIRSGLGNDSVGDITYDQEIENMVKPLYQIGQFFGFFESFSSSQSTSWSGLLVPLVAIEAAWLEKTGLRANGKISGATDFSRLPWSGRCSCTDTGRSIEPPDGELNRRDSVEPCSSAIDGIAISRRKYMINAQKQELTP